MPANSTEAVADIEESLKSSLQQVTAQSLDARLASSSKKILLHKIDFQPSEKSCSVQFDQLRAKYPPLNPSTAGQRKEKCTANGAPESNMSGRDQDGDGLPSPKVVLYPPEGVRMEWPKPRHAGPGLYNAANTCFINATLQCLSYTPPLANYLQSGEHKKSCAARDFCLVCELQKHIHRCFSGDGRPFEPTNILRKLKLISRHLQFGRQEDAHEFLRYVIDGMHKAMLYGHTKLDRYSKETTLINQIFGGFLRSQVLCLRCKGKSNTYDPVMDISLDVKNVQSIQAALHRFVQPDTLDKENAYSCTKCNMKVPAQKRFTLHRPPNILTIQLKRFDSYRLNCKVTHHVGFSEEFNLRQYMSIRQGDPVMYSLYGVLVHSGSSTSHGHYIAYVRSSSNMWYLMNDHMVSQVSIKRVFAAEAYVLFYRRKNPSIPLSSKLIKSPVTTKTSQMNETIRKLNGSTSNPVKDMGTPLIRTQPVDSMFRSLTGKTDKSSAPHSSPTVAPKPSIIPNVAKRDKISFGIKPKENGTKLSVAGDSQPRIVLTIKKDKKGYKSVSDSPQAKLVAANVKTVRTEVNKSSNISKLSQKLVPYNGETSDSETGNESSEEMQLGERNGSQNDEKKRIGKSPSPSGAKMKHRPSFEPVLDEKLNTTTVVPGSYGPLNKCVGPYPVQKKKSTVETSCQTNASRASQKSLSENGLSVVTNDTGSHINATTPMWSVLEADLQVSPSVASASGSSNTSLNSTTEWKIENCKKQNFRVFTPLGDNKPPGWKVTTQNKSDSSLQENVKCENTLKDTKAFNPFVDNLNITLKRHQTEVNKETVMNTEKNDDCKTDNYVVPEVPDENEINHGISKGFSSVNLLKTLTNGYVESDASPQVSCMDGFRKKKKKRKHQHDSIDEDHCERKRKKKKKDKRKDEPLDDKHIQKEHKDGVHVRNKHKYAESEFEKKLREQDNCEETEYVWVEKTKETLGKTEKLEVPVQQWDAHSKDKGHANSNGDSEELATAPKSRTTWHGERSSNLCVVTELQRMSHGSFGNQVDSWDGAHPPVREQQDNRFRHDDTYDDELDHGKTKKLKKVKSHHDFRTNPFQRSQDYLNEGKTQKHNSYSYSTSSPKTERKHLSCHNSYNKSNHNQQCRQDYRHDHHQRDYSSRMSSWHH